MSSLVATLYRNILQLTRHKRILALSPQTWLQFTFSLTNPISRERLKNIHNMTNMNNMNTNDIHTINNIIRDVFKCNSKQSYDNIKDIDKYIPTNKLSNEGEE